MESEKNVSLQSLNIVIFQSVSRVEAHRKSGLTYIGGKFSSKQHSLKRSFHKFEHLDNILDGICYRLGIIVNISYKLL